MKRKPSVSLWMSLPVSCLALLSAGWTNTLRPPAQNVPHEELSAQSSRMNALYDAAVAAQGERISINLDLSDDAQYGFARHRLGAAGKNEANAPELFSRMKRIRERALARRQAERARGVGASSTDARPTATGGIWCDHYVLLQAPSNSNNGATLTYQPYVRVSCEGGSNYVYADIVVYNVNQAETDSRQVASEAGEEYGEGTDFIGVGTTASVNITEGRKLRLESFALAVDDVTGRDVSSYTVARTSIAAREEGGITLLHPREVVPNAQADILMCQLRGGADCDYAVAGYDARGNLVPYPPSPQGMAASRPDGSGLMSTDDYWRFTGAFNATRLYIPLRVNIKAGSKDYRECTVDQYTYARIKLHTEQGVTCANTVDFLAQLPTGKNSAIFNYLADTSYNINGGGACAADVILNRAVAFNLTVLGKSKCTRGDGTSSLEPFYKSYAIDGRNLTTQRLFYRNSCMAQGTHIQMADGRSLPVEQVQKADKVRTGQGDTVLTVTDVARGNELKPLVHLRDTAGHELLLTEMHPVIKADGEVVAAAKLKVSDKVRTDKGVASLTSVKRVPVQGKRVFNLKLGTEAELAALGNANRTLLAGGILVGDLSMQEQLERPEPKPSDLLARLPKAWHQDYKNSLK